MNSMYLQNSVEQVPIPGPWVSGPGSRWEQVPFLGPGTRVLGPRVLGPRSRKRNWAEQVPFPGPGTWDPTKVHKNKVGHYLGSRVPGPRSQIAGSEVAGSHVLGPSWWVPTARSQLLGPSYCWVPLGGSLRVGPFGWVPSGRPHLLFFFMYIIGIKNQNSEVNFKTSGTWCHVGQWSLIWLCLPSHKMTVYKQKLQR